MYEQVTNFLGEYSFLLTILGLASLVCCITALLAVPRIISALPADYFAHDKRPKRNTHLSPVIYMALRIVKNVLAVLIIMLGIMMLVLPGQGLMTMMLGILLLEYPGKYRFEKMLFTKPVVARVTNAMRRRHGKSDFII